MSVASGARAAITPCGYRSRRSTLVTTPERVSLIDVLRLLRHGLTGITALVVPLKGRVRHDSRAVAWRKRGGF